MFAQMAESLYHESAAMRDVKGLNINGDALQETFFMNEQYKAYHKLFLFYGMEAKFRFDNPVAKGTCSIVFEFPDFASKKDRAIELEANISGLTIDSNKVTHEQKLQ